MTISTRQRGQSLLEYALIIALVAVLIALTMNAMGISLADVYSKAVAALEGETGGGDDPDCTPLAVATDDWKNLQDKFWRGGIKQGDDGFYVCPLCGGLLPGFSGNDYAIDLPGVKVSNVLPSWNGYGVAFRADYQKSGLNGYMFEIERVNKKLPTQIYFSKWVNGKQIKPPLASITAPANFDWDNPPNMTVKVEGDQMIAYLNGVEVLRASDSTYPEGGAGVIANMGTQLQFKDFYATRPQCVEVK